jgi:RNA polymerase primary sigma factor
MRDSVGQYLHEIGLVPLLNAAQERELSQKIEAGRDAQAKLDAGARGVELKRAVREAARARDYFIRANLRLVVSIARRYPLPPNLGLEHAVEKFDWRKGFKFSTYATFWIRQAIGRALDQKANLVRLPSERSAQLRAALRDVSGEGDDLDAELANLHRLATPTSLDRTVGDDGEQELVDLLPDAVAGPEQVVVEAMHTEQVTGLLDNLEPRARVAVEQRFGLVDGQRRSFREVGEALGVTAEAARRIVKRAVDELKVDAEAIAAA